MAVGILDLRDAIHERQAWTRDRGDARRITKRRAKLKRSSPTEGGSGSEKALVSVDPQARSGFRA